MIRAGTSSRTWRRSRLRPAAVAVAGLLVTTATGRADWVLDFDSPPPPNFVMTSITAGGSPSATFSGGTEAGMLRMRDTRLPAEGGSLTAFGVVATDVFTDVRVTGTLNPAGTSRNDLVLLARAHVPTVSSYAAGINFSTTGATGTAYILKFLGGAEVDNALSTDPQQGSQPRLDVDRSYFLEFDAIGNELSLRVLDAPGGLQLAQVTYSDAGVAGARFTSGVSGVASQVLGNTLLDGTFDNISAVVIPEPTSLVLGAGLFGLASLVRWRGQARRREPHDGR